MYMLEVMYVWERSFLTMCSYIQENRMSSSADNVIISLNFRYRNAGNKNILFVIEISKDKKVSDLEEEVRKKLGSINHNDFLRQIYPKEKPMRTEDRIFPISMGHLMMKTVSTSEFFPNEQLDFFLSVFM